MATQVVSRFFALSRVSRSRFRPSYVPRSGYGEGKTRHDDFEVGWEEVWQRCDGEA